MTKISLADVRKVAKLSRLELPDDQIEMYTTQLEKILTYVEQLQSIDTENIVPTTRAVEVVNVLREDTVRNTSDRDEILDQAPHRDGDFFRVPRILSD